MQCQRWACAFMPCTNSATMQVYRAACHTPPLSTVAQCVVCGVCCVLGPAAVAARHARVLLLQLAPNADTMCSRGGRGPPAVPATILAVDLLQSVGIRLLHTQGGPAVCARLSLV
jgi:hypothetical protein